MSAEHPAAQPRDDSFRGETTRRINLLHLSIFSSSIPNHEHGGVQCHAAP